LQTFTGNPHFLPLRPIVGACNSDNIKKANKCAKKKKTTKLKTAAVTSEILSSMWTETDFKHSKTCMWNKSLGGGGGEKKFGAMIYFFSH
jgi:hypothetical protein